MQNHKLNYLYGTALSALFSVAIIPLLPWAFDANTLAIYTLFLVYTQLASIIMGLGLDQSLIRYYYEVQDRGKLFNNSVFLPFFLILLLLPVSLFHGKMLANFMFGIASRELFYLVLINTLLLVIVKCQAVRLRLEDRSLEFSVGQVLQKLVMLVFVCVSIFFVESKMLGWEKVIIAYTCINIAIFILYSIFLSRINPKFESKRSIDFDIKLIKFMLNYSLPLLGSLLVIWGMQSMDKVIVKSLLGLYELGIYSNAFRFAAGALILQQLLSLIWVPMSMKWYKEGAQIQKYRSFFYITCVLSVFVYISLVIMNNYSEYILPVEYHDSINIVPILLLYPIYFSLSEITTVGILFKEKTKYSFFVSFLTFTVSFLSMMILVPMLDLFGAAISISISYLFFFLMRTLFSQIVWLKIVEIRSLLLIPIPLFICFIDYYKIADGMFYFVFMAVFFVIVRNNVKLSLIQLRGTV